MDKQQQQQVRIGKVLKNLLEGYCLCADSDLQEFHPKEGEAGGLDRSKISALGDEVTKDLIDNLLSCYSVQAGGVMYEKLAQPQFRDLLSKTVGEIMTHNFLMRQSIAILYAQLLAFLIDSMPNSEGIYVPSSEGFCEAVLIVFGVGIRSLLEECKGAEAQLHDICKMLCTDENEWQAFLNRAKVFLKRNKLFCSNVGLHGKDHTVNAQALSAVTEKPLCLTCLHKEIETRTLV